MIWLDPRLWLAGLLYVGSVGGAAYLATHLERSDWQARELDRRDQARDDEKVRAQRAAAASLDFERWRRDQARRHTEVANALSIALRTPISCPATLAEVVLPAAAVDELRRAGDDDPGPDAAPAELVR